MLYTGHLGQQFKVEVELWSVRAVLACMDNLAMHFEAIHAVTVALRAALLVRFSRVFEHEYLLVSLVLDKVLLWQPASSFCVSILSL